jgi:hypothetical protein
MPPVEDFLEAAGTIALFNTAIFFIGRAMRRSMKRKGMHRRAFHGWYVWVWVMGGVIVGGLFLPWSSGTVRGVPLAIGLLAGWFGGMIHGGLALQRYREPPEDE